MTASPRDPLREHLDGMRDFAERAPVSRRAGGDSYQRLLADEYNRLIPAGASVLEVGCGAGGLLARLAAGRVAGVDLSARQIAAARERLPGAFFLEAAGEDLVPGSLPGPFDVIILSDTLNFAGDVQRLLGRLHAFAHGRTRLIVNFPSALWRPLLALGRGLGLADGAPPGNWLSPGDVAGLMALEDWETVRVQPRLLLPVRVPLLAGLVNRWVAPLLPWACLTVFSTARPRRVPAGPDPVVSVVIPARNESGNIKAAVLRTPEMGAGTEIIFVEGGSRDDTWAEIQRVAAAHPGRRIRTMRQAGRGKGDAVRTGFAAATGDIFMILDADLTVPPEELPKFYEAVRSGRVEFANGSRLVYPMERRAMQFLNMCANKAFGILFSWVLAQPVKDTLCGTKVLRRADYERIVAGRAHFGDFDPFGDFDLLFGAARLGLRISDIPIRYRERTYGTTNIQRWRHGWMLLRMLAFAARKLKFV